MRLAAASTAAPARAHHCQRAGGAARDHGLERLLPPDVRREVRVPSLCDVGGEGGGGLAGARVREAGRSATTPAAPPHAGVTQPRLQSRGGALIDAIQQHNELGIHALREWRQRS